MSSESWKTQVQRSQRSVLMTVKNYTHMPLARVSYNLQSGVFRLLPQEIIPPYAEVQFAATSKGLLSGTDGTVVYKALVSRPDVSFSFWFRNPFVDPRQAKCTVEPPSLQNKFKIQQSDVSDNHFEITWCVYTSLSREEAPLLEDTPADPVDATWTREQLKAPRSVTIAISNNTSINLYRKKTELTRGSWTCLPPDVLIPGKTLSFGAKGATMTGTTGRVVYQSEASSDPVEVFFDNPFLGEIQVVHSRPKDFHLNLSFRKQEHLRVCLEILPSPDSSMILPDIVSDEKVLSSSSSSALPLHKVNQQAPAQTASPPSQGNPHSTRITKRELSPTQLVSGEEDEDDETRRTIVHPSPQTQASSHPEVHDFVVGPPAKRVEVSFSSSQRVSLDLVHNAARFRLFGVPLRVVIEKENSPAFVPRIVALSCSYLCDHASESVGLFVKPGSLREVLSIRAEFERGESHNPVLSKYQVHSVGTVLKMFLRELPSPIIPVSLRQQFVAFAGPDQSEPSKARPPAEYFSHFMATLPHGHKQTLQLLLKTFQVLSSSPSCDLAYEDVGVLFGSILCPDAPSQRPGQWTGVLVAKTLKIILENLDDINFEMELSDREKQSKT